MTTTQFISRSFFPHGMQQPVLPHFPEGPLNEESLERFSDELMAAYNKLRVTTNIRPQSTIKRLPVRLDVIEAAATTVDTAPVSVTESEGVLPQSPPPKQPETISEPPQSEPSGGLKCFLHPKPKSSCRRCQEYLSIRKSNQEPSPKKPRS